MATFQASCGSSSEDACESISRIAMRKARLPSARRGLRPGLARSGMALFPLCQKIVAAEGAQNHERRLYHINPESPAGWEYGWDESKPETLITSGDRVWPAENKYRKLAVGDLICVYMKNIPPNPNGIYVVGRITQVLPEDREFRWEVDHTLSARMLMDPVPAEEVKRLFGRSYGSYMQQLPARNHQELLQLIRGTHIPR